MLFFGANAKLNLENVKFKPFVFDTLSDDTTLSLLYSSADVMVVPSRQENFLILYWNQCLVAHPQFHLK